MHLLALISLLIVPANANGECAKDYALSLRGKCTIVMWFGVPDEPLWVERAMCSESDKTIAVLVPKTFDGLEGDKLTAALAENSSLNPQEIESVTEHIRLSGYQCADDRHRLVVIEDLSGTPR